MKLYLLQHAQAKTKEVDPERPLTTQGLSDLKKLVQMLGPLEVDKIYHSGKLRAQQTAEIIAQGKYIEKRESLAPNDAIDSILTEIQKSEKNLLIVGHLPFLGKLAAKLLTGKEDKNIISFQPGTIVCLERQKNWSISLMLPANFL